MTLAQAIQHLQNNQSRFEVQTTKNTNPDYWVETIEKLPEESEADLVKESIQIILSNVADGTLHQ